MKAIVVRNLTKDYKIYSQRGQKVRELLTLNRRAYHETKRALDNLSFEVETGECVGVIGDNGCGKSTLLRLLAQTSFPTAGEIEIHGDVSYLLDPTIGFNPEFSGRENIFTKCSLLGMSNEETEALFPKVLEFSGLGDRIDHPIKTYSSGMTVRLGFSVAVHVPFDILLIDEVLSVGDFLFQRKCVNAIRAFREQGKTILISSHSLSEISAYCDRLILLTGGAIGMLDRTDHVVRAYIQDCDERYSRIERREIPVHDEVLSCCTERVGKARIVEATFCDDSGAATLSFRTGGSLTARLALDIEEEIENPCIRLQFLRNDGTLVFGANTYRHEMNLGVMRGRYEAVCRIETLNLLAGDYYLNVGIWPDEYKSFTAKTPYDVQEFRYVIAMRSERGDGGGLARLPCQWSVKKLE